MSKQVKEVVVVIPVHSSTLKKLEQISLDQCFKVLSGYDIVIIHPEGLDLKEYEKRVSGFKTLSIKNEWFTSHKTYNDLKRNLYFYNLFKEYKYLLTYELDCFVFHDELKYWCSKGYDFIGAPWFDNYTPHIGTKIIGVGNSGFSLRKVKTCIDILSRNKMNKSIGNIVKQYMVSQSSFFSKLNLLKLVKKIKINSSFHLYKSFTGHEDAFWCIEIPKFFPDFKKAPVEDAYKFSIEEQPEYLIELNNNKLPFGCHAWYRFDYWKPVIKSFGYDL